MKKDQKAQVETVRVEWMGERLFRASDRAGSPILITQPEGVNAADLLPLSVLGCMLWDIELVLRKQRQEVTGLEASAHSLHEESPPWRFRSIHIIYRVRGRGLDAGKINHVVELIEQKYCSTYATLHEAVEITSEVEIVDEPEGQLVSTAEQ